MSDETVKPVEAETPESTAEAIIASQEQAKATRPPVYKCPVCKHVDQVVKTGAINFSGVPIVQCRKCNTRFGQPAPEPEPTEAK